MAHQPNEHVNSYKEGLDYKLKTKNYISVFATYCVPICFD
jgi:hypothetical protein